MPLPDTSPIAIPSCVVRQQDEVVVVAADAERGAAGAGVVEAGDRRVFLRKQPLLHVARDFDVARLLRARRHFGRDRCRQPAVLEREPGLRRHRVEQTDVRLGERLFRLLRPQAHDAEDLLVERQGQQQLRLQRVQRAPLLARRQLHPRIRVVELHERVLLLARAASPSRPPPEWPRAAPRHTRARTPAETCRRRRGESQCAARAAIRRSASATVSSSGPVSTIVRTCVARSLRIASAS